MKVQRVAWLVVACTAVGCGSANDDQQNTSSGAIVSPAAGAGGGPANSDPSAVVAPGSGGASASVPIGSTPSSSAMPAATHGNGGASGGAAGNVAPANGSGGGSAMNGSGGAAAAQPDPPGTVTLTMDKFMLAAGQEIYKCQNFDNPFDGQDTAVGRIATDMSPGSHHLHVYHMTTSASRTLEDCDINDFHPLMHAAGSPHAETTYPEGMAVKLKGSSGIRIQVHYLNALDKDLEVNAVLKLSPVDSSSVSKWISELYFNRLQLSIPPGTSQSVTTSCTIPSDFGPIGLISGGSHMHHRGTHFTAQTGDGKPLIDTTQWDEPAPTFYDPPVMLNPGDSIRWTCTYDNDTGAPLVFGESAQTNEMCIYLARFFSDPNGDQIECQAQGDVGQPTLRTY